jgi:alcohol dehydrogenase class IV
MPSKLTAETGMDLLAQAVESFWSLHATNESKNDSAEAIGLWNEFFIKAVSIPDPETRQHMQWAAFKAGKAIHITRTTGPHALSYYLTVNHAIPHGQAVALFLPLFFLYNKPGNSLCRLLGSTHYQEAAEMIRNKMKKAGLAITFSGLGLSKEEITDDLLREVNEERFANNPVPFDAKELKKLILEYL